MVMTSDLMCWSFQFSLSVKNVLYTAENKVSVSSRSWLSPSSMRASTKSLASAHVPSKAVRIAKSRDLELSVCKSMPLPSRERYSDLSSGPPKAIREEAGWFLPSTLYMTLIVSACFSFSFSKSVSSSNFSCKNLLKSSIFADLWPRSICDRDEGLGTSE